MRGKKVKEMRQSNPAAPNPNRVLARIQIVAYVDGRIGISGMPVDEGITRAMMTTAAKRMNEFFEARTKAMFNKEVQHAE